ARHPQALTPMSPTPPPERERAVAAPPGAAPERTVIVQQLELLLSEKRTSLSVVRTGTAIAALPLSILSLLVATSKLYAWPGVEALLVPRLVICALLSVFAASLVVLGVRPLPAHDRRITELRRQDPLLGKLFE